MTECLDGSHLLSEYEAARSIDSDAATGAFPMVRQRRRISEAVLLLSKVLIFALALFGLVSIPNLIRSPGNNFVRLFKPTVHVDPHICDCGATINEAVSLGCRFVPMAAAWLPPPCIDQELSDEFDAAGPGENGSWSYWSDAAQVQEITLMDVALLADSGALFYTTWEWHVKHCTFYWRLDYRRRWLNTILEPRYDHESHVTHCQMIMFADRTKPTGSDVKLNSSSGHGVHHEQTHQNTNSHLPR